MTKYGKELLIAVVMLGVTTTLAPTVFAGEKGAEYGSNGVVKFIPNTDPVDPVDPTDPTQPVDPIDPTDPEGPQPGTEGPLSIDYASSFQFGVNKISSTDEIYYADAQKYVGKDKATANYVQVTDNRGTSTGWKLSVKQEQQLRNETAKYAELKGAVITLKDGRASSATEDVTPPTTSSSVELTPGEEVMVMNAAQGAGDGTWVDVFGTVVDTEEITPAGDKVMVSKNKAITLSVPGKTPKSAVEYRSKLTWILAEVQGNDA